jgi:cation diffusion facilitator family transporter
MGETATAVIPTEHEHVFLSAGHSQAERRAWAVIVLCAAMMALEIIGGALFGSIALIADGLHMSTHAGALLLAALAYSYARKHSGDARFSFGTGKLGDLAGFSSAIVLAMIALLIGYEAITRLFAPVPIRFEEAIPIAILGLGVNMASAWLLASGGHHHHHGHGHSHGHGHEHDHGHDDHDETQTIETAQGPLQLSVFETDHPPVFRVRSAEGAALGATDIAITTVRPDGARQSFTFANHGDFLQSVEEIPEPHAFTAVLTRDGVDHACVFAEHDHAHEASHRDNNLRAAIVHVMADAAVSVLVIVGLVLARAFGWLWMDPLAGIVGAFVIASWSFGLIKDTGAILLDMTPDRDMEKAIRLTVEAEGDRLTDLHVWRLGPGHLGAILSVATVERREPAFYRARLARFRTLSHVTVEVQAAA